MALKDNISKIARTVGEGAAAVAKKSGETLEIAKLNLNVDTEEEKIKILYSEIGVIIYNKYKNGKEIDQDIVFLCEKIKVYEEKVLNLKQKVLEIKNVRLCTGCSEKVAVELKFCPKCGTKIE